jgi:two-component system sensor histidine kinase VanS
MKLSIKHKLLLYMMASVFLFGGILFFCNTFLVEKYYLEQKKQDLRESSKKIVSMLETSSANPMEAKAVLSRGIQSALFKIERSQSQTIFISSAKGDLYFPAMEVVSLYSAEPLAETLPGTVSLSGETGSASLHIAEKDMTAARVSSFLGSQEILSYDDDHSYFSLSKDSKLNINTLQYHTTLENGIQLLVSMPMSAISEGTAIINRFLTVIGLTTIAFTILWAWFVSYRFTAPITQMNRITDKMQALDFSESIQAKGKDEIAQLSQNINRLSNTLDSTIGELNRKNEKLAEDINKERKIDKMRRDFISNVSHELKTPIFLIQGYADGLKSNITLEEKKNFYCSVISEEAEKMDGLVRDLLMLARMESGAMELYESDFELNHFLRTITEKYDLVARERGITIELYEGPELLVHADPVKIEQVVTNLLNNAMEHTEGEKVIKIGSFPNPEGSSKVRVFIRNTGKAISQEDMDKIWNSFYKINPARTRNIGGAGLGLSIVKAILTEHHSDFGAVNKEDGVEFWFELTVL